MPSCIKGVYIRYSKGIYLDPSCPTNKHSHAVYLVGYGKDATAGPYWILRNQWGTGWVQKGYMIMARGVNQCGVANNAAFPVVYG